MRQVIDIYGRIAMLVLVLMAAALPASAGCERLQVTDGELWTEGEARSRIVRDPRGIVAPSWSPGGEEIAYGREADFELDAAAELVLVDRVGRLLRTLALPEESPVNAILEVGWRGTGRVWAVGHVNPSTSMYLEWDVESGRLLERQAGALFAVSPDGRSVASLENVPHGAPPPHDSARLVVDGEHVWPADDGYHRIRSNLAWAPDNRRIAFLDEFRESTELVVVEGGKELSRVRLDLGEEPQSVDWMGDEVVVGGSEERAWRVSPTGTIEESDAAPPKVRCRPSGLRQH